MASIISHAIISGTIAIFLPKKYKKKKIILLGIGLGMLPDADVVLHIFNLVQRGSDFAHRGFSHSIVFAFIVAFLFRMLFERFI